ncbi:MAG: beta-ketoacyl-ACP synthase III [Actinomycetota bacterium]
MGASIAGWGAALPARRVTNADLAQRLGVDETWILERTGIRTRHLAAPDDTSASLGSRACLDALAAADVSASDVDFVIAATSTPDYQLPATAPLIQHEVGAGNAAAFDIGAACSGFLYGLAQATALIEAGMAQRVLVCGTDVLSRVTDHSDARTAILFGDGAGAALVEKTDRPGGLGPFVLRSDGSGAHLLRIPREDGVIRMEGREVYRRAVEAMTSVLREILVASGATLDDIALVVAHQANGRILEAVAARLGLDPARMVVDISRVGNTSAASIPLALVDAHVTGRLHEGDLVALAAFGGGFVWGAGTMRWRDPTVTTFDAREVVAIHA